MIEQDEVKIAEANMACANTCLAVMEGLLDNRLSDIVEAVNTRREVIRLNKAIDNRTNIKVGDRVWFAASVAPAYLQGMTATVRGSKPGEFKLLLDKPIGKFKNGIVLAKPHQVDRLE
jgi:hypothetical protein